MITTCHPYLGQLQVDYRYHPEEKQTIDHPGYDERAEIVTVSIGGTYDMYEALCNMNKYDINWLEEKILKEIKEVTEAP